MGLGMPGPLLADYDSFALFNGWSRMWFSFGAGAVQCYGQWYHFAEWWREIWTVFHAARNYWNGHWDAVCTMEPWLSTLPIPEAGADWSHRSNLGEFDHRNGFDSMLVRGRA